MANTDRTARIENTAGRDPLLHLAGGLGGASRYISEMESAGQQQFVHSDRLPTECPDDDDLRALGFELGDPDPADPLFRPATLPAGWRREASDHPMGSHILDANGRKRVEIFYKAAFYDRRADMRLRTIWNEVTTLLWGSDPAAVPIVDEWTTREGWIEALSAERGRELATAIECERYYPEGAVRARARAARCDALLAGLVSA